MNDLVLGIDVGGTKLAVSVGTSAGEIVDRLESPTEAHKGFDYTWSLICRLCDEMLGRFPAAEAVGVSIGGPLNAATGTILSPPNLPGWDHIPLRDMLAEHCGRSVFVEHDAKAGALAEWMFGAGRNARNVVFLTLGTGLGCGVISDGQLLRGARDGVGQVGHWRMAQDGPFAYGKSGSWEGFVSGPGLAALAHLRHPGRWNRNLTSRQLIGYADRADKAAKSVIAESAQILGMGVAYLVDLLDPDVVILGSLAVRARDWLLPTVRETVKRETATPNNACRIETAALGERVGDVAAICAALYYLDRHLIP